MGKKSNINLKLLRMRGIKQKEGFINSTCHKKEGFINLLRERERERDGLQKRSREAIDCVDLREPGLLPLCVSQLQPTLSSRRRPHRPPMLPRHTRPPLSPDEHLVSLLLLLSLSPSLPLSFAIFVQLGRLVVCKLLKKRKRRSRVWGKMFLLRRVPTPLFCFGLYYCSGAARVFGFV